MVLSFIIRYKKGRRHDYDIYKENHPITPKKFVNVFDLGYLGVETDFHEQLSSIPNRKQRNRDLSQEEKEYNINHALLHDYFKSFFVNVFMLRM